MCEYVVCNVMVDANVFVCLGMCVCDYFNVLVWYNMLCCMYVCDVLCMIIFLQFCDVNECVNLFVYDNVFV